MYLWKDGLYWENTLQWLNNEKNQSLTLYILKSGLQHLLKIFYNPRMHMPDQTKMPHDLPSWKIHEKWRGSWLFIWYFWRENIFFKIQKRLNFRWFIDIIEEVSRGNNGPFSEDHFLNLLYILKNIYDGWGPVWKAPSNVFNNADVWGTCRPRYSANSVLTKPFT